MSAWETAWDALSAGIREDRYVKGIPTSVVTADPSLTAAIDEIGRQREILLPPLDQYRATLKASMDLILKVCGPFK